MNKKAKPETDSLSPQRRKTQQASLRRIIGSWSGPVSGEESFCAAVALSRCRPAADRGGKGSRPAAHASFSKSRAEVRHMASADLSAVGVTGAASWRWESPKESRFAKRQAPVAACGGSAGAIFAPSGSTAAPRDAPAAALPDSGTAKASAGVRFPR